MGLAFDLGLGSGLAKFLEILAKDQRWFPVIEKRQAVFQPSPNSALGNTQGAGGFINGIVPMQFNMVPSGAARGHVRPFHAQ